MSTRTRTRTRGTRCSEPLRNAKGETEYSIERNKTRPYFENVRRWSRKCILCSTCREAQVLAAVRVIVREFAKRNGEPDGLTTAFIKAVRVCVYLYIHVYTYILTYVYIYTANPTA